MHVLTLVCDGVPSPALKPLLQAISAAPPPAIPGLCSRHWCAEGQAVLGRYLFNDRASLEAFARDTAPDPALAIFARHPSAPRVQCGAVEEIATDDIFDRPVFVISAPRAGSMLLFELLAEAAGLWTIGGESHGVIEGIPSLHVATCGFESHRLTAEDADPQTVRALRAGLVAELRDRHGRRYLELPLDQRPQSVRLLEKTPENSLRIPFLEAAFPDALFVFLHRDARQNISSLVEAWHHDGFVNIPDLPGWEPRRWCFLLPPGWQALAERSISDVAALQWHAANEHALDDLAAVPRERWTVVEYSDLVAATERVARRVCDFARVEVDPPFAAKLSRPAPLSSTTISPPSPIKWRSNPHLRESSFATMGPLMGRLRNLTTPTRSTRPEPRASPRVRFSCFLDELQEPPAPMGGADCIVDPSFHFQLGATVPLPILRRTRFREQFLADHPLLWVEDGTTRVLYPFWAQRNQVWLLRDLAAGQRRPATLRPSLAAQLERAGILVTPSQREERQAAGMEFLRRSHDEFALQGYCMLPSLIHPDQIAALARYYRALIQGGSWELGDAQVEQRHGWYNELVARFFHLQLCNLVSGVGGEPVKPTYCYSSAYHGGASLRAHMDRRQCEYTLSLLIDRSPGATDVPWPLWFQAPSGKDSVTLGLGDAVLFRGCELAHWREAAPSDQDQTMLLFHYVPMSFVGVLD